MVKILLLVIIISVLSYVAASIAHEKNHDFWIIFWISMVTSPIIGFLIAFLLKTMKNCEFCFEKIKPEATVCRYCRKDIKNIQNSNIIDGNFDDFKQDLDKNNNFN